MKKADMFFDIFINEYVEILQDYEVTTNITIAEELREIRMPMTVTGYVKDTDDYFLFLSTDGNEINQALPIESIKHIGILQQTDPIMEMLDQADTPEGNSFNQDLTIVKKNVILNIMEKPKQIKLELVKDEHGIAATNQDEGYVELFDEDDQGRQEFVLFMLDEFINKEVKDGKEIK